MYPCKNCIVRIVCTNPCDDAIKITKGEIAKYLNVYRKCLFCGHRVYRTKRRTSSWLERLKWSENYRCKKCNTIFCTVEDFARVIKNDVPL